MWRTFYWRKIYNGKRELVVYESEYFIENIVDLIILQIAYQLRLPNMYINRMQKKEKTEGLYYVREE